MGMKIEFQVTDNEKSLKVIEVLKDKLQVSTRLLRKLKKEKKITVNGHIISLNAPLRRNDLIEVLLPDEENIFEPEDIKIDVIYEDDHIIIINKQPFIVVHPTKGHPFSTIGNGIANYMINKDEHYKIRFANRLDRDTSGLMIICKNGYSQKIISDQMISNKVEKKYYAVVNGILKDDTGTINLPIGKINEDDVCRAVVENGLPSVTHYAVIERFKDATLVEVLLETGRTHQIRVHFKEIGHILIGDELYGDNHNLINRQALHSFYLKLENLNSETVVAEIDMYDDMKKLIEELRS